PVTQYSNDTVGHHLRLRDMDEDVKHHVHCSNVLLQLSVKLEPDHLRDLHHGESGVHEIRILGGPYAPGHRVVHAAHAGVAVGSLDEIARVDDVFARHLVADAGRDVVGGREVAAAGVLLEVALQLAQCVDLVEEG